MVKKRRKLHIALKMGLVATLCGWEWKLETRKRFGMLVTLFLELGAGYAFGFCSWELGSDDDLCELQYECHKLMMAMVAETVALI